MERTPRPGVAPEKAIAALALLPAGVAGGNRSTTLGRGMEERMRPGGTGRLHELHRLAAPGFYLRIVNLTTGVGMKIDLLERVRGTLDGPARCG